VTLAEMVAEVEVMVMVETRVLIIVLLEVVLPETLLVRARHLLVAFPGKN
jgi:hypothetical protein